MADLVRSLTAAALTLREPGVPVSAELNGLPVEALVELCFEDPGQLLDPITELLRAAGGVAQGWRVDRTTVFDSVEPTPPGRPSEGVATVIFIQGLDGTTEDYFSRNWYLHAALDPDALPPAGAGRPVTEADGPIGRYVQNRLLEPVTASCGVREV